MNEKDTNHFHNTSYLWGRELGNDPGKGTRKASTKCFVVQSSQKFFLKNPQTCAWVSMSLSLLVFHDKTTEKFKFLKKQSWTE